MITIPQGQLKTFLTVARRAGRISRGGTGPPVTVSPGRIATQSDTIAITYQFGEETGSGESVTLPLESLAPCKGSKTDPVRLESNGQQIVLSWQDGEGNRTERVNSVKTPKVSPNA